MWVPRCSRWLKKGKRLLDKPALNSSYLLTRLKIRRNEALENMARETVMTKMKQISVRTHGLKRKESEKLLYNNSDFHVNTKATQLGFDYYKQIVNRNAKKLSIDNCKTYSPPGLHSLFLPPCTLAPMLLCWLILHRGIFQLQHPGRQSRWPCLKWRQRGGLSLHMRPWNLIIGLYVLRWKKELELPLSRPM